MVLPIDRCTVARQESADSRRATPAGCLVGGQILSMSADDYGESADDYIPTGGSALEPADSELELGPVTGVHNVACRF